MIQVKSIVEQTNGLADSPARSVSRRNTLRDALKIDLSKLRKKLRELFSFTTVSISIEGSGLKTLETKGRKVIRWQTIPLDPEIVKEGVVVDSEELGKKIRDCFRPQGKLPKKVVAGVTGLHSLSRLVTLPKTPGRLLKEAISRESQRTMPVSLEHLDLSWQSLPTIDGTLSIYILATPQNILNGHIQAMTKQGINPYLMDMKPLALARAANCQNAFILDIQPEEFDIILVADGIPLITRTVLFPQRRSSMDVGEERVVILIEEFLRTVKYFENTLIGKPANPDTPLFLTGEIPSYPALQEMVTRSIRFPVTTMEPPLKYPPTFPVAEYATNVGLTLKELLPASNSSNNPLSSDVNFNILPDRHRKRTKISKKLLWTLGILTGIALFLPIYEGSIDAYAETASMKAQLSKTEQSVTLKALDTKRRYTFQVSVEQAEASVGELELGHQVFNDERVLFAEPLEILMSSLTDGIRITSIGDNNGIISINGYADSYALVVDYTQILVQEAGFPQATIIFVQGSTGGTQGESKASFQLNIGRYVPEKTEPAQEDSLP